MFGSLLDDDKKVELFMQWLPDWCYSKEELDLIKREYRWNEDGYWIPINVKSSGMYGLDLSK